MDKNAYLILEDGTTFKGKSIGSEKEVISEVVFNTSMTGYLEILTDPSYAGQAVTMTYPMIGNYGICRADMESDRPRLDALIVRELSRFPSNFRSQGTLQDFLEEYGIPGICGIDTRALTKALRDKGTMNGMVTTTCYEGAAFRDVLEKIHAYKVMGSVEKNTTPQPYVADALNADGSSYSGSKPFKRVAFLDLGTKRSIIRSLQRLGMEVSVFPAGTKAKDIIAMNPDGILISNGPGDPKDNADIIREISILVQTNIPIFAICLGHQLVALATGADTYKLKYGHRGGNHPVRDLATGGVYISAQNHGYAVNPDTLDPSVCAPAFINANDQTNEGIRYLHKNIFTVQFHPEACPGPMDSHGLFKHFSNMMEA